MKYEANHDNHSIIKEQKLWKTGNSTVVTIPKEMMDALNVSVGDVLKFDILEEEVSVTKKSIDDLDILKLVDRTLDRHGKIIEGLIER
ncbi:AbrB/MazE/SpoVT family DNA-binding domain-containing protein [Macrococcus armenti]|uniref:AbrB/MazE/SpoVT family DNA-binding domain-containing protein n=1 Tax=Macrococcus armenti TaxID=2875764 RepID=UPI001CCD782A|nr:AbrB/MazE/SpoVT family DNA-binding domain-containing protein [Macrococcus armenti]UBH08902.1 AbrB/MazE/SpoVT family DNA-binding domain-containing protein [Macrococcus armenti]